MAGSQPTARQTRARRGAVSRVKLEDVARLAGVSTATASRVINSPSTGSDKTRRRVEEAIERLGWIPHGAAKALASMQTRTIGALIPTLGHQTIAAMLEALQEGLSSAGYTLLLGRPDTEPDRALDQAAKMVQTGIECLVLMGEDHPPELFAMLQRRRIFYVIVYTIGGFGHTNCIGFDNFGAMTKIVRYLLEIGHTSFGVIARTYDRNDRTRLRINAIHSTLAEHGLAVRPQHFKVVPDWTIGCGRDGMQAVLAEASRPTAVICTNDYLASGAVIEAQAQGLRVPEDISVTGFDDIELSRHVEPPLTTVHVPATEMGLIVAEYLIRALDKGETELPPPIESHLIIRASTGPARPSE